MKNPAAIELYNALLGAAYLLRQGLHPLEVADWLDVERDQIVLKYGSFSAEPSDFGEVLP